MARTKESARWYTLINNYKLGLSCEDCGNPRSNASAHYCGDCIKKNRKNKGDGKVAGVCQTTEWFFDDLGNQTRLHGDLSDS